MLPYLSPAWAIAALAIALATSELLRRRFSASEVPSDRYAAIDGLRGYLAFFVFVYHASIWYGLLTTGKWAAPPSHLYTHFGQSSVALFFMVTAFLFFGKILREPEIDWPALFVGRVVRLYPLYLCVVAAVFVVTFFRSHGQLNEAPNALLVEAGKWLIFTMLDDVSINKVDDSWLAVAGVTWSLAYEWLFYACLPLLAWLTGRRAPPLYRALSLVAIIAAAVGTTHGMFILSFFGGLIAAVLSRSSTFRQVAAGPAAPIVVVLCVAAEVDRFETPYSFAGLSLLTITFVLIASGCSLFGILTARISRWLGDLSYSIYLLHGLVLFVGMSAARRLGLTDPSPAAFWATVLMLTPVLIALAFASYRFIERPPLDRAREIVHALKSVQLGRLARVRVSTAPVRLQPSQAPSPSASRSPEAHLRWHAR